MKNLTILLSLIAYTLTAQLHPNGLLYASPTGSIINSTTIFNNNGKVKVGSTHNPLSILDIQGDFTISQSGSPVYGIYSAMGAGGYNGRGEYCYTGDWGFGCKGAFHWVGGNNGNTHIATLFANGDFQPKGSFVLGQDQYLYSSATEQRAKIVMGGESQSFPITKIASFRYNDNVPAGIIIENPHSGNNASPSLYLVGEPTTSPANHARYLGFDVTSTTYTFQGTTIVPPNVGFIHTGGNLAGGMMLYADDGPVQLRTDLRANSKPSIHVNPLSLNGITQVNAGFVGIGKDTAQAQLDVKGGIKLDSVNRSTATNNTLWIENGNLKIKINGSIFNVQLEAE